MGSFFKKSDSLAKRNNLTSFAPDDDELYEKEETVHFDLYSCVTISEVGVDEDLGQDDIELEKQKKAKQILDMKGKIAAKEKSAAEKKLLRKKEKEKEDERKIQSQIQAFNDQSAEEQKKRKGESKGSSYTNNIAQHGVQQTPEPFKFTMPSFKPVGMLAASTDARAINATTNTITTANTTITTGGIRSSVSSCEQASNLPSTSRKSYLDSKQPSAVQQQLLQTQALKQERDKQRREQQRKEQESFVKQQGDLKLAEASREKERAKAKEKRLRVLENKVSRKTALVAKAKVMISW